MEQTFYEDARFRNRENVPNMKRPMTLDLNGMRSAKKPRGANPLLTSPDLHKLKLESPELDQLIIQQHGLPTGQCMYPKDDDRYTRDFPDTLGGGISLPPPNGNVNFNLYQNPDVNVLNSCNNGMMPSSMVDSYGYHHQPQPVQQPLSSMNNCNTNPMVSSSANCYPPSNGYYSMDHGPIVNIKEEPQTVPCVPSPPRSPIDMEDQERLKLERKRLRNRIAASKCRRRKLEKIARLEDRVSLLKSENSELLNKVTFLKDQVCHLKQQVLEHVRSGCDILTNTAYPCYGEDL